MEDFSIDLFAEYKANPNVKGFLALLFLAGGGNNG